MANMVRMRVTIRGTRPLLQHAFGPDAIPLEKAEKTGVPGNDPEEWKRSCMVTADGRLCLRGSNAFSCIRDGAKKIKRGKGSIQAEVASTLQIEETVIVLNRKMPKGDPPHDRTGGALGHPVYVDVSGVRNPNTKGRNVRYRLAASPGWECTFTLLFDKTVVPRELMKSSVREAGVLVGIADGRTVGNGRFSVVSCEEMADAEETPAEGSVAEPAADRVGKGRKKVQSVSANGEAG